MSKISYILIAFLAVAALDVGIARAQPAPSSEAPISWRVGGVLAHSEIWPSYRSRFVREDGRVVDTANGGISHSEGQGYGLLLAVAADDRKSFDRILTWTLDHLFTRQDRLAAWNTHDSNDSADADILIAWALAEAADLWREPRYLSLAQAIGKDIAGRLLDTDARFGVVLKPGARGFSAQERRDGPVVNLSYWVFPAFERLGQLAPDTDWAPLRASGLALLSAARFGDHHLTSDWVALGGASAAPARGFSAGFGYNAVRLPLYVFWSGASAPDLMRDFSVAWDNGAFSKPALASEADPAASFVEPGYKNILSLARCAAFGEKYPRDFYDYTAEQNYYPATLSALAIVAAATRGGPCLDTAAMSALIGGAALTPATDLAHVAFPAEPVVASGDARPTPTAAVVAAAAPAASAFELLPAIPTADGDGWFMAILAIAGAVAIPALLGGIAFLLYRRRARARKQRLETLFSAPAPVAQVIPHATPRTLPHNPYHEATSPALLAHQMENAAAASIEFGKTLGVIYFDLGERPHDKRTRDAQSWDHDVSELLERLQNVLRGTDHVAFINDHEVVACIGLLPGLTELTSIANRLRNVGGSSPRFSSAFEPAAGLAVYPLGGYRGEELIQSARAQHRLQFLQAHLEGATLEKPARRRIAAPNETAGTLEYSTASQAPRRSKKPRSPLV